MNKQELHYWSCQDENCEVFTCASRRDYERKIKLTKTKLKEAEASLAFIVSDCGGYEKEVDEGLEHGYIWSHIAGRAKTEARRALKRIKG